MQLVPYKIAQYAYNAGFRDNALVLSIAVALAESGGDTAASLFNPPTLNMPNGSTDRGLWQINNYYHSEVADICAYDPQCCAYAAYRISGGGSNFTWWTTYKTGAYVKYLSVASVVAANVSESHFITKHSIMPWSHELVPWHYRSQLVMPTQAGYPSTNRQHDCGPACISMVIQYLFGIFISEDNILVHEYWKNYIGDTTIKAMQDYMSLVWKIQTTYYNPSNIKEARRIEDKSIRGGNPVILLGYIMVGGQQRGHFRCCTGISNKYSIVADPANGQRVIESKSKHWNSCVQGMIVVN